MDASHILALSIEIFITNEQKKMRKDQVGHVEYARSGEPNRTYDAISGPKGLKGSGAAKVKGRVQSPNVMG